jgi:zinc protease
MRHNRGLARPLFVALILIVLNVNAMRINAGMATGNDSARSDKKTAGMEMLTLPSASPLITLRVIVRAGSAYDPSGKEGLATLTAALLNEGGNQTLSYKEILKKLYPMAGSINAQADKEVVTFVGEIHKDNLDNFYRIFADNLLKPRFDSAEFERLREDAINNLAKTLRGNNDEELGKQALEIQLYQSHPYGHAVGGTVQGLKRIKLEDVKDFYKRFYTRSNIMIGTAGDLPEQFLNRIKTDFAALPEGTLNALKLQNPMMPEGLELTIIEKETDSSAISFGFPINITRKDPDFYALLIANSFLGEHRTFNGILMQNMRAKRGLNYGDYSYIEHFVQDGGSTFPLPNTPREQQYFSVWIRPVSNENRLFALREAMWEIDRFINKGMSEQDFESTRRFLLNYCNLWIQTLSRRLGYRLDSRFYGIEDYIGEIQKQLPKLTRDQVNAAVKKYLNARSFKAVIVTRDAENLKSQLLSNAPSPIKYESATPQQVLDEDKEIEKYMLPINREKIQILPVAQVFEN